MISNFLRCQSKKSELSIDVLTIYLSLQSLFELWDSSKIFLWNLPKKCYLSAILNFVSLSGRYAILHWPHFLESISSSPKTFCHEADYEKKKIIMKNRWGWQRAFLELFFRGGGTYIYGKFPLFFKMVWKTGVSWGITRIRSLTEKSSRNLSQNPGKLLNFFRHSRKISHGLICNSKI